MGKQTKKPSFQKTAAVFKKGPCYGMSMRLRLILFLMGRIRKQLSAGAPNGGKIIEGFYMRARALTPVEMRILNHHMDGMNEKVILSEMFIDMKTIREQNENICSKLGASSFDELMLYIELMKMSGMAERVR